MDKIFAQFLNDIKKTKDLKECYKVIDKYCAENTDFEEKDLNLFKYKNIFIRTGKSINMEYNSQIIESLKKFNLSCAPEFVESIKLNDEDMILLTRVDGIENDDFEYYMPISDTITKENKQKLAKDFETLAKKDLYNPVMVDSAREWFVIPKTKTIYIDKWNNLQIFQSQDEINEKRKALYELCELD